jgi:hypothetical protein
MSFEKGFSGCDSTLSTGFSSYPGVVMLDIVREGKMDWGLWKGKEDG